MVRNALALAVLVMALALPAPRASAQVRKAAGGLPDLELLEGTTSSLGCHRELRGVGGFLGLILTAFLANSLGGLGFLNEEITSSGAQLVEQLIGAFAIAAWCAVISFVLFKILDATIGLRMNEDEETEGLDLVLHDERGYNL